MGRKGKDHKKKKAKKEEQAKSKRERKKQSKKEKRGKKFRDDWDKHWKDFNNLLRPHGLSLHEIRGDGNCLFRSFADQIERDENLHANYRAKCIAYMRTNRDEFEPFMTEDYDDYVDEMAQLQEWGGNMEIIAMSRAYQVNVIIHHETDPRYEILYPDQYSAEGTIHISYHDESHYNSVRPLDSRETGVTDILAPDEHKDPTYERPSVQEEEVEEKPKGRKSKKKKEGKLEKRQPTTSMKKLSKRERKRLKKQQKAMKNKQKSENRAETKKNRSECETSATNDPGTIRI